MTTATKKTIPPNATFELKPTFCNKPSCKRCPHGPYWYAFWEQNGKTKCVYVGKERPDQVAEPEEADPDQLPLFEAKPIPKNSQDPPATAAEQNVLLADRMGLVEALETLNITANEPWPNRGTVRKRVWNLKKAKSCTAARRALLDEAFAAASPFLDPEGR